MAILNEQTMQRLRTIAEQISQREGCLLYDLEFSSGGPRTLRVYIDRDQGAASLDDCVNVSRGLNLLLDVEDVIPGGSYDLEVSSPGIERKLTQPWHFQRSVKQTVRCRFRNEQGQMCTVEGELSDCTDQGITLHQKNNLDVTIGFAQIERAQVIFAAPTDKPSTKPKKKR